MKYENPEYLGSMYLHAGRHALKKMLKGRFKHEEVRKLRMMLPYHITEEAGIVNRFYKPMGEREGGYVTYDGYAQYRIPEAMWKGERPTDYWLFNDGCPPWMSREHAENYLKLLDELFEFEVVV